MAETAGAPREPAGKSTHGQDATAATPLTWQLQAILFVASEPLTATRLAEVVAAPLADVETALAALSRELAGGIRLSRLGDEYRLVTAPVAADTVRRYLQAESKSELSRPALETLAIVAYRGPVTKLAVERIRGVASDVTLRNLLARGLIREAGKSTEPGRPVQYAVSHSFLQHFGLTAASELPPIPEAPIPETPTAEAPPRPETPHPETPHAD